MFHVEGGQLRTTVWKKDTKLLVQLGPNRKVKPDLVVLWASKKKKIKRGHQNYYSVLKILGVFSLHTGTRRKNFSYHMKCRGY